MRYAIAAATLLLSGCGAMSTEPPPARVALVCPAVEPIEPATQDAAAAELLAQPPGSWALGYLIGEADSLRQQILAACPPQRGPRPDRVGTVPGG